MTYAASAALNSYGSVDTAGRVAAASPHELVTILFDHLMLKIDQATRAAKNGDNAKMLASRAKALNILWALEDSLDFDKAPDIAKALAVVYREATDRLNQARGEAAREQLASARQLIAEIADAWKEIGRRG